MLYPKCINKKNNVYTYKVSNIKFYVITKEMIIIIHVNVTKKLMACEISSFYNLDLCTFLHL